MQSSAPYRLPLPRRPNAGNGPATPGLCPFLGTPADPGTSLGFPSDSNHCFSTRLAVPISTIHQENYCLTTQYEACPVYRQHTSEATSGPLLPLTAVAVAGSSAAWGEPGMAVASTTVAEMGAARPAPYPLSAAVLDWNETPHPDFQADAMATPAPARRVNSRWVWLGLLLLALIPVAWWLWTNALPGSRGEPAAQGAVVTLPTLAITIEAEDDGVSSSEGQGVGVVAATATPEADDAAAIAATTLETTATATTQPTATDLENIAATVTAMFTGATVVAECDAPSWWVSYSAEVGDTIESLAAARGILPEALIVANCLTGPDLAVGVSLLLPPVGIVISLPAQSTPTRSPGLPTRVPPILFPTPTFPAVVIIATAQPTPALPTSEPPTDEPPTRPPSRPTTAPTSAAQPTATPPSFGPTSTPPLSTQAAPTLTPPGGGTATTPGATGTVTPTLTPPAPIP